jgi:glycosyltransferase involved in cell wall biosynthesis
MICKVSRISLVVPVYGDAELAYDFCAEVNRTFTEFFASDRLDSRLEIIFICDGLPSDFEQLRSVQQQFQFVHIVELSRNFGQHVAIACGYKIATGDIVVMTNIDQQDPPSQIPKLLESLANETFDIAYGVSNLRVTGSLNTITSIVFSRLLNFLAGYTFPDNVTTMRAMKRPVIEALNQLVERQRFLPGLEGWIGFQHVFVPIQTQARLKGKSSYNFRKRAKMAMAAIVSFSDLPLRLVVLVGLICASVGFVLGVFVIVRAFLFSDLLPGFATLVSLITFLGGVTILSIGMSSIYIGRILAEVQARPLYIVRRSLMRKQ